MYLYRFTPEFQFRVYTAVEDEVLAISVERGHWWMMGHLLANYPEGRIFVYTYELMIALRDPLDLCKIDVSGVISEPFEI